MCHKYAIISAYKKVNENNEYCKLLRLTNGNKQIYTTQVIK